MVTKLDDVLAKFPEERQEAIKKRTAELLAEEASLRLRFPAPPGAPERQTNASPTHPRA